MKTFIWTASVEYGEVTKGVAVPANSADEARELAREQLRGLLAEWRAADVFSSEIECLIRLIENLDGHPEVVDNDLVVFSV
jgi:hypothetical protein